MKPKFEMGQVVYYMRYNILHRSTIKAIFTRSENSFEYMIAGEVVFQYDKVHSKYLMEQDNCKWESDMFPTRDALIKSIKDEDLDEEIY